MGRAPCCDKENVKRGPWSPEEDAKLKSYIENHGTGGNWIALPPKIGLKRCGKSCRLRWLNYLRPNLKHGGFTHEEDNLICTLYISIGSRWSIIAAQLPGRTDNDIKNYWNTRLKKKLMGRQRRHQAHTTKQAQNYSINDSIDSLYNNQISPPTLYLGGGGAYSTNSIMPNISMTMPPLEEAPFSCNNLQTTTTSSTDFHYTCDPFISVEDQQHLCATSGSVMNCSTSTSLQQQQQLGLGDFRAFDDEFHERRSYPINPQEMDGLALDNLFDTSCVVNNPPTAAQSQSNYEVRERKTSQNWTLFFDQPRILGYSE